MARSNYANFLSGVTIRGVPITQLHPGEVFWVNTGTVLAKGGVGGSDSNKGTYTRPFGTIDGAVAKCTAGRGDIIVVMPGSTATISAAAGVALDVAGIAMIGLGTGSLRPTITLDTAIGASFTISAANITLANFLFSAAFADITQLVDVTGTDATIAGCEFVQAAVNENWVDVISATGAAGTADGLKILDCNARGVDAANNSFLQITDDISRLTIKGNHCVHDHANALAFVLQATGKKTLNLNMQDNHYDSLMAGDDILYQNDVTTNTGVMKNNSASHANTTSEILIDVTGVATIQNFGTGVITLSGYVLPAIDA